MAGPVSEVISIYTYIAHQLIWNQLKLDKSMQLSYRPGVLETDLLLTNQTDLNSVNSHFHLREKNENFHYNFCHKYETKYLSICM